MIEIPISLARHSGDSKLTRSCLASAATSAARSLGVRFRALDRTTAALVDDSRCGADGSAHSAPDPERLRWASVAPPRPLQPPHHRPGEPFLKGPIPKRWLERAAQARGKALHVAVELWFQAGIRKRREICLGLAQLSSFGVDRFAASRGLKALEHPGLVSVVRHPGRQPVVTILDIVQEIP